MGGGQTIIRESEEWLNVSQSREYDFVIKTSEIKLILGMSVILKHEVQIKVYFLHDVRFAFLYLASSGFTNRKRIKHL